MQRSAKPRFTSCPLAFLYRFKAKPDHRVHEGEVMPTPEDPRQHFADVVACFRAKDVTGTAIRIA